jgi:hypothetical protein
VISVSLRALRRFVRHAFSLNLKNKDLTENPPEGIISGPVNEDNFFIWEAAIT